MARRRPSRSNNNNQNANRRCQRNANHGNQNGLPYYYGNYYGYNPYTQTYYGSTHNWQYVWNPYWDVDGNATDAIFSPPSCHVNSHDFANLDFEGRLAVAREHLQREEQRQLAASYGVEAPFRGLNGGE